MADESNLLKLVSDLGSKIEGVKTKISSTKGEGEKWKVNLLATQKALSDKKLQLLKLRVRLSNEKEQLAEKEETFHSCLTEIQSDVARLTSSRSWMAQSRLQLDNAREQRARLMRLMQQHAAASRRATEFAEPAQHVAEQRQQLQRLQDERDRLESTVGRGAALQSTRQRSEAAASSRAKLERRLADRQTEERQQQNTADALMKQVEQKQVEMAADKDKLLVRLTRARTEQGLENERLRSLELRAAQLRSQLEDASQHL